MKLAVSRSRPSVPYGANFNLLGPLYLWNWWSYAFRIWYTHWSWWVLAHAW